ncbi:MAG: hypothetical protein JSW00_17940 [Thermoplasmata archaeon]|nr:MAG: hypothetical protein JSW00_17940 [Thermoplasmata archaeon]
MAKVINYITIFIIIIMITIGNFGAVAQPGHPGGEPESETGVLEYSGDTNEGSSWEKTLNLLDELVEQQELELDSIMVLDIVFVLTWTDEEADSDPDEFSIMAADGMGEPQSDSGSGGEISIMKEGTMEGPPVNDTWDVVVTCIEAGDSSLLPVQGPMGLTTENDPGNSWELVITFHYFEGGMGGGPPANVQAVLESPIFKIHIALMVMSVFLFLGTGLVAGVFGYRILKQKNTWEQTTLYQKLFSKPDLLIFLVILTFLVFFIASVPIGMWVAGMFYGWNKAWTGFPALWNPEAFEMTNADNVSFIVLLFWAAPMYINRAQIMRSKYFKKLFGWSKFAMKRAEKAPDPKLSNGILALCYCLLGIMTFVIFEVQPHGSGS